jgi:hypothetical protein
MHRAFVAGARSSEVLAVQALNMHHPPESAEKANRHDSVCSNCFGFRKRWQGKSNLLVVFVRDGRIDACCNLHSAEPSGFQVGAFRVIQCRRNIAATRRRNDHWIRWIAPGMAAQGVIGGANALRQVQGGGGHTFWQQSARTEGHNKNALSLPFARKWQRAGALHARMQSPSELP